LTKHGLAAKRFIKQIPHEELRREIDIFLRAIHAPAVERDCESLWKAKTLALSAVAFRTERSGGIAALFVAT